MAGGRAKRHENATKAATKRPNGSHRGYRAAKTYTPM